MSVAPTGLHAAGFPSIGYFLIVFGRFARPRNVQQFAADKVTS